MNALKNFLAAILLTVPSYAQVTFTNGGFEFKLSPGWSKQPPPSVVSQPISQAGGKMLFYAESASGKFFVSRFDFPAVGNQVSFVAGFIGGVRNSTKKGGIQIDEKFGTFRGTEFPTYTFSRNLGDNFIHSESIFCVDKLYNIQIVGLQSGRDQLLKALDGVTIHDKPMARSTFEQAREPNALARNIAYEAGRRMGFVFGAILIVVVAVLGILFLTGAIGGRKSKPPPLPPQAPA